MTARDPAKVSGNAVAPTTSSSTSGAQEAQASQATSGGVNLRGTTRNEARVQSGTATAVGQQNNAGNRVGSIGGN